ncbi:hypothetical protein V6N11_024216 [Hibiscus sabdariffa]
MALATVYATIPAVVAAAVGIYSFDRHSGAKEFGGGVRSSMGSMPAKANQMVQTTTLPKVAPQFDGLNCFETLTLYHSYMKVADRLSIVDKPMSIPLICKHVIQLRSKLVIPEEVPHHLRIQFWSGTDEDQSNKSINFPGDESIGHKQVEATSEKNAASTISEEIRNKLSKGLMLRVGPFSSQVEIYMYRRCHSWSKEFSFGLNWSMKCTRLHVCRLLQSSCTMPHMEADSADMETMQEVSDFIKENSRPSELQIQGAGANLAETVSVKCADSCMSCFSDQ